MSATLRFDPNITTNNIREIIVHVQWKKLNTYKDSISEGNLPKKFYKDFHVLYMSVISNVTLKDQLCNIYCKHMTYHILIPIFLTKFNTLKS